MRSQRAGAWPGDALFCSCRTGPYLEFPAGAPSRHFLSDARKELRLGLRRVMRDAVASRERAHLSAVDRPDGCGMRRVRMSIEPFDEREAR